MRIVEDGGGVGRVYPGGIQLQPIRTLATITMVNRSATITMVNRSASGRTINTARDFTCLMLALNQMVFNDVQHGNSTTHAQLLYIYIYSCLCGSVG